MSFTYKYPRAALTVDAVVFGFDEDELKILLIKRGGPPFKGQWALPGGFVEVEETLDDAVKRELQEEAGLKNIFLEQLYTFGAVNRDPRERIVSVAYYALVKRLDNAPVADTDAAEADWFPVTKLPKLAFDHMEILKVALTRLRNKLRYQPIGFELLPDKFTLTQLQHLYETVLGESLDKRNFRKKALSLNILTPLDETLRETAHRPARLFRFDTERYNEMMQKGILFEL